MERKNSNKRKLSEGVLLNKLRVHLFNKKGDFAKALSYTTQYIKENVNQELISENIKNRVKAIFGIPLEYWETDYYVLPSRDEILKAMEQKINYQSRVHKLEEENQELKNTVIKLQQQLLQLQEKKILTSH